MKNQRAKKYLWIKELMHMLLMYEQTFTVNIDNGDDFEETNKQQRETPNKGIHEVQGVFPALLTKTTMSHSKCSS